MRYYTIPEIARICKMPVSTLRYKIMNGEFIKSTTYYGKNNYLYTGEQAKEIKRLIEVKRSGITF